MKPLKISTDVLCSFVLSMFLRSFSFFGCELCGVGLILHVFCLQNLLCYLDIECSMPSHDILLHIWLWLHAFNLLLISLFRTKGFYILYIFFLFLDVWMDIHDILFYWLHASTLVIALLILFSCLISLEFGHQGPRITCFSFVKSVLLSGWTIYYYTSDRCCMLQLFAIPC